MRPQLVRPNILQEILDQKVKIEKIEVKTNNSRWFTFFMIVFFLFVCLFIFMRYIEKKSKTQVKENFQEKKSKKNKRPIQKRTKR